MEDLTLPVQISGEHALDKEGLLSRQWWSNSDITASVLPFIAIVGFFLFGFQVHEKQIIQADLIFALMLKDTVLKF